MSKRRSLSSLGDSGTRALVRRLWSGYVRRHGWRIALAMVFMVFASGATGAQAYLLEPIINDIFVAKNDELLWMIALAAFVVFAVKGFSLYGQAVLMSHIGLKVVADLQSHLYARLLGADLSFFHKTSPGLLVARFINDVNLLQRTVSSTLVGIGKDSVTALVLIGVMFYQDWMLALMAFLAFPTAILPIVRIGRRMRKVSGKTQEQTGLLTTLLDETFQGMRQVKAYGMEAREQERADARIFEVFRLNLKAARVRNISSPIMEMLGGVAIVAVILYGGGRVISGDQDPGSFTSFIAALLLAYEPIKRLSRLNTNLQEGLAAAVRVFELIDLEPKVVSPASAPALRVSGAAIALEQVRFAYEGADVAALEGVSLEAKPGETIALVGASGAGKSTVLNLIPRFYDVDEGRVTIDGQDLREVSLISLRAAIALVSQEILLFDDSIAANIAYGSPQADLEKIQQAARMAGAHDFISGFPDGYDTQVGPRGAKLSGGQRQRVAIARALLKDAPILLLDEATSALDTESERVVQQALKRLMANRTTLVIAHRLSTVVDADCIYVMDRGRVIESGRHEDLLARQGAYAQLYHLQFGAKQGDEAAR